MSHGPCSYICMYLNTVANRVMLCYQLYLKHDFYNLIFQIKRKLYTGSVSAPAHQFVLDCFHPALYI